MLVVDDPHSPRTELSRVFYTLHTRTRAHAHAHAHARLPSRDFPRLIGAGKTTLATALAKELGLPVYYEPVVDNVYLADFYQDMKKYSFPMQIYLLNKRFKQQQEIIWTGRGGVQDRTIYEDSVFASMLYSSGHMDTRDYQTYRELFSAFPFMRRLT